MLQAMERNWRSLEANPVNVTMPGGTLNKTGSFRFAATKVGKDTALATIIRMVKDAQGLEGADSARRRHGLGILRPSRHDPRCSCIHRLVQFWPRAPAHFLHGHLRHDAHYCVSVCARTCHANIVDRGHWQGVRGRPSRSRNSISSERIGTVHHSGDHARSIRHQTPVRPGCWFTPQQLQVARSTRDQLKSACEGGADVSCVRQYEPILYGWKDGTDHYWCGARDQGDVWFVDKPVKMTFTRR